MYAERRQTGTISTTALETSLQVIASQFSIDWLKRDGAHPLQQLWNRSDVLSTNELFFFGECLRSLAAINPKWVTRQVRIIKSDHYLNRQGAFFEICGLGMFCEGPQTIRPSKDNQPGHDAILSISPTKSMRLSLKNYGDSYYFRELQGYGNRLENQILNILKEKNTPPLQIVIDADRYPGKDDWQTLIASLGDLFDDVRGGVSKAARVGDCFNVLYGDLPDEAQPFHENHRSYTLIITTAYHQNEQANLLSKLDDACANLAKHSIAENESLINAVFVHLPESGSMEKCVEWVADYFVNAPGKPISCVLLYQPTVATVIKEDYNVIHHCYQIVLKKEKIAAWNTMSESIHLALHIGVISHEPAGNRLIVTTGSETQIVDLSGKYIYQRGNHYVKQIKKEDGTITGDVTRKASGIFLHSVFEPIPGQGEIILSGRFAPVDKLLIL